MNRNTPSPFMTVKLRESTVAQLMLLRCNDSETLDTVVERMAKMAAASAFQASTATRNPSREEQKPQCREAGKGKYSLSMSGKTLRADTLGALFAEAVDALAAADPKAVENLAKKRARKRAYIARHKQDVHPGRPDLQVLQTSSGWWVSANVGKEDIKRGLRALCAASGLTYARDLSFDC